MAKPTDSSAFPILVDFDLLPGLEETSSFGVTVEQQQELAQQAMATAMLTIRGVAEHLRSLHETLPAEFEKIEVEFGVKLDVEAGALLAKAGGGAHLDVTLVWRRSTNNGTTPRS